MTWRAANMGGKQKVKQGQDNKNRYNSIYNLEVSEMRTWWSNVVLCTAGRTRGVGIKYSVRD